jgi:type I restriction enzyme S subunit
MVRLFGVGGIGSFAGAFELPEGWAFIRLNTAWELISGRDLSPSEYNDKNDGIPYITGASNFKNGNISLVRWTPVPQVIF